MQHELFSELKDWSERKHELVIKYLEGFVRILGGSRKGTVYYVDGFAGPGIYNDGSRGSPIRAAEYASSLVGKYYQLQCINVEADPECFENLRSCTKPFDAYTQNRFGSFADNIAGILTDIGEYPTIFFLDPFGVKGIEWKYVSPILSRPYISEVLLRVNPKDLSCLAGFSTSQSRDAARKKQVLTDLYGFHDSSQWEESWNESGMDGLVDLYARRLLEAMPKKDSLPCVCSYGIKTIDGTLKYYLLFATRHPKGALLMSDTVYHREKCYDREVNEYQKRKQEQQLERQLSMMDNLCPPPTEDEIFTALITTLKIDIYQVFQGKKASRIEIHTQMLPQWFGKISKSHVNQALKELEAEKKIIDRSGTRSDDKSLFTFESVT